MEVKYYVCNHCGNIIEMVKDKGVPVICCGEAMHELKAGVTDAAVEKHVPVYTVDKQHVHVVVGKTKHPMLEEHFIEWITLNTNQGIYRKQLNPGQEPVADFCLCDGEQVEEVYAYCNLHGLWKEMLSIDIIGLAGACSYALDCIEAELVNIKNKHGKRVAYISIRMAEYWKIQGDELQDLAMCALLHDNALTQYISEELKKDSVIDLKKDLSEEKTNLHCIYGEKNITKLPFKTDVSNVILYHHEHADGTGPFQKKWNEIPLFARIIHLADIIDIIRNSIDSDDNSWDFMCQYLSKNKDSLFDSECVNAFLHVFTKESFMCLSDDSFETKLWEAIPREKLVFDWEMCKDVADFFAKIVDYKSSFTSRHSMGVAEKASMLAQYMGYDSITVQKMYLAGALHDIGKMAVGNEILEKPDKLTDDEFSKMKNHAGYTYLILSEVNDFEEIRDWAAFHHEKLNGKGYPFGKTAAELNEPERMMACVDIYQALTEDRPYKKGLSHEKTCDILDDMAQKDFIDSDISKIIRECFGRNR